MTTPTRAGRQATLYPALCALLLCAAGAAAAEPALLRSAADAAARAPVGAAALADLVRRPRLQDVELSPDGSQLAYLTVDGRNAALHLYDVATGRAREVLKDLARTDLSWARDGSVLFLDSGTELSVFRLADGSATRVAALERKRDQQVLAADPVLPHHVLVEDTDPATKTFRIERIDAAGQRETLYAGAAKPRDLLVGPDGKLAFIKTLADDYSQVVARQRNGKWDEVTRCRPLRRCTLAAASPDGKHLALVTPWQDDRAALVDVDVDSGARRLRQADPRGIADLGQVVLDARTRQPLLAAFRLPHVRNVGLTGAARGAAADIAARFPHANIAVAPSAGRWLLTETAATLSQPRYWLYDPARHSFAPVLEDERARGQPLDERQLAPKYALTYPASDGQPIHGYVTLPPGRDAAKAPMITVVHGGPWSHFESGYEWFVQWLATRGYAVFQPNFRASTGYGDKFMLAPGADFGNGRVQRDIVDGVRWLTAHGIGDPASMAVTGGSFGGYSTLLALTWTPELFRFGLAMVPPPEFSRTLTDAAAANLPGEEAVPFAVRFGLMGLRLHDAAALEQIRAGAPAAHPDRMARPLVIMAGGKDDKVRLETVTAYVASLQALGKPVSLLVDPDEGHNARNPLVREAYTYLMAGLLHRYLDGPAPTAPTPELKAYLDRTLKADGALAP